MRSALLLLLFSCPAFLCAQDAACAWVRIDAPAGEGVCRSSNTSNPGQPVYAINVNQGHALGGVIIRHRQGGAQPNNIGPIELEKPPSKDSRKLIACPRKGHFSPAAEYDCRKATLK